MTETLDPPTLSPRAKYGLAGQVVDTLHPYNEGDEATILAEYLTLFGGFLGLHPHFNIGKTPHYARIFMAVVGQSAASRKGTTFNLVRSVFDQIDPTFLRMNVRKNIGSDQGIISAALDSLEYAQANGLTDGRLIVVENEFVTLLSGGTLQRTSPMIRDAWDTNVLQSTVKRSRWAEPVHLCIIGMITLDELRHLLPNHRVQAQVSNGLFNRFLMILATGSKHLRLDQMHLPEKELEKIANKTHEALEFGRKLKKAVPIEKDVIDAQYQWRQDMAVRREREIKKAKIAVRMFDLLNRGETYLLRLAFIYAMLDKSGTICLPHYEAAEALWRYVEDSVRYIFEIPEFSHHARQLLDAIQESGIGGINSTKLHGVLGRRPYFKDALRELENAGVISLQEIKAPKGKPGRPQKVYRLAEYADLGGGNDLTLGESIE